MENKSEIHEGGMSETETEARRIEIVERLRELAKTIPGGSSLNNQYLQEALSLEQELLRIDPPGGSKPVQGPAKEIKEEHRVRPADRAAISQLLEELRRNPKK